MTNPRRITLLTDFGVRDGYVGAMKGVLAARAPGAMIDDIGHDVPPGDIQAAAWALRSYWRLFPEGTVHLVVVDPGVGGARRAIAASLDDRLIVAPDNGVITLALARAERVRVVDIVNGDVVSEPTSATFHGRDVFAPAAAALAADAALESLGATLADPVTIVLPEPGRSGDRIEGVVVHVDRFGSLISNIPADWCAPGAIVRVDDRLIGPIRRTYTDVAANELVALIGSGGLLEVALRDGSAAGELGVGRGARMDIEPASP